MNDIDAMWVQDPYKSIFANHPDVSIFAQRGAFPGIFKRKWGAAACMGFIYFRATEVRCVMRDNSRYAGHVRWAGRYRQSYCRCLSALIASGVQDLDWPTDTGDEEFSGIRSFSIMPCPFHRNGCRRREIV